MVLDPKRLKFFYVIWGVIDNVLVRAYTEFMEPQQPPPPLIPIQSPPTPSHSHKRLKILLIIFVFLFLTTMGVFAYQIYQANRQASQAPIIQPPTSSSPTPHETAEWKTYTNEEYKFMFKYPSNWKLSMSSGTELPSIRLIDPVGQQVPQLQPELNQGAAISLSINEAERYTSTPPLTLSVLRESYLNQASGVYGKPESQEVIEDQVDTLIGLRNSVVWETRQQETFAFLKDSNEEQFLFEISIEINNSPENALSDKEYLAIFNQILSTFRFVEEEDSESGIEGKVTLTTGNCMPPIFSPDSTPGPNPCATTPVKRKVYVRESSTSRKIGELVSETTSDENGMFRIKLPLGTYSVFVEDNGKENCARTNSEGILCIVVVDSGYIKYDPNINNAVW